MSKTYVLQLGSGTPEEITDRVNKNYASLTNTIRARGHEVAVAAGTDTFDAELGGYRSYYQLDRVAGKVVCQQVVEDLQPSVIRDYTGKLSQDWVPQLNAASVVAITENKERLTKVAGDLYMPISAQRRPLHHVDGIIPADEAADEALAAMGDDAELRWYTFGAGQAVLRAVARSERVVDGKRAVKWAHLANWAPDHAVEVAREVHDRIRQESGAEEIHTAIDLAFDGDTFNVVRVSGINPAFPRVASYPEFTQQLREDLVDQLDRMAA